MKVRGHLLQFSPRVRLIVAGCMALAAVLPARMAEAGSLMVNWSNIDLREASQRVASLAHVQVQVDADINDRVDVQTDHIIDAPELLELFSKAVTGKGLVLQETGIDNYRLTRRLPPVPIQSVQPEPVALPPQPVAPVAATPAPIVSVACANAAAGRPLDWAAVTLSSRQKAEQLSNRLGEFGIQASVQAESAASGSGYQIILHYPATRAALNALYQGLQRSGLDLLLVGPPRDSVCDFS